MMDVWFEKLGFADNPLTVKPVGDLVGYDDLFTTVNAKIGVGSVVLITGRYGFGKSTLLKGILARFKGKRRIIYLSCNTSDETVDFDRLLVGANHIFGRALGFRRRGVILLLDEAQDVNVRSLILLPKYCREGFFSSVVLVTSMQEKLKLPRELSELVGDNHFHIGDLSDDDAVRLIRRRFNHPEFLPDNVIKQVFHYDRNPRGLLKNCEDICRDVVARGREKVTLSDVKRLFDYATVGK